MVYAVQVAVLAAGEIPPTSVMVSWSAYVLLVPTVTAVCLYETVDVDGSACRLTTRFVAVLFVAFPLVALRPRPGIEPLSVMVQLILGQV